MTMKYLSTILALIISIQLLEAQNRAELILPEGYAIDGSISVKEIRDTTFMKVSFKTRRFVIKKSKDFTYIAIRSNSSSILNAYVITDKKISVLHASAALGQIDLVREADQYVASKTAFDWIYRDPESWDEKHPDGVDTIEAFYKRFEWMANTWHSGSYREIEMLIDNNLIDNNARLIISYTSIEDGEYAIRFKEGTNDISISGDEETDNDLHNGYIPQKISAILP